LVETAKNLENGGAKFIIISNQTLHKVYDEIKHSVDIPVIHVLERVKQHVVEKGYKKIALIGTTFTMQNPFFKSYLTKSKKSEIEILIPQAAMDRALIHSMIHNQVYTNEIGEMAKFDILRIIKELS